MVVVVVVVLAEHTKVKHRSESSDLLDPHSDLRVWELAPGYTIVYYTTDY